MNFLVGYYARRGAFHIVESFETIEEVETFLKNSFKKDLVVYEKLPPNPRVQADAAPDLPLEEHEFNAWNDDPGLY